MPSLPSSVVVHPLVLLSAVDHFNRVAKGTNNRVVGVLLGESTKGVVHVTNSYAVPFEEDSRDPSIWFVDHNYHENMYAMFRKVSKKERIVGWYSTGPRIKPADIEIHDLFRKYCQTPILVIVDVNPKDLGLPTEAYGAQEEASADGSTHKSFVHIPSEIGAYEAEEVGVEHLLRDVKDSTVSTFANQIQDKLSGLKGLIAKLEDMRGYLDSVLEGKLPANPQILSNLQDIFNLLPNLQVDELVKSFAVKTNDMLLVVYLCSMIRSTIALHDLINNKLHNKELEAKQEKGEDKDKDQKDQKNEAKDKDKKEEADKSSKKEQKQP